MDPRIELRHLRYFVAVAEELHFGRAAQRLHMSQSPLSRAIRDLERELGVALFVRTTRHVELTPAGFALLEGARRALAEIDSAIEEARRATRPDRGVLKVGYGPLSRAAATRVVQALAVGSPRPGDPAR
jgi:DNA-binding transcriptional LysR family regulator